MSWGLLNLVVLILYLLFMVYLGIWSERGMTKSASGYLLAERSATLPWIIMSIFATGIGTLAYIGTIGMISKGGVIDLWFEFFWCIGTPLMALLFVRKLRTSGIISFLDSIAFRFGAHTLLIFALFLVISVPFSFAQMLKGAGLTFTDMFPALKEIKSYKCSVGSEHQPKLTGRRQLFELPPVLQTDLGKKTVLSKLRSAFERNRTPLSQEITLKNIHKDKMWLVEDGKQKKFLLYHLRNAYSQIEKG